MISLPRIIYTPTLQLIFLSELIFLMTNTIKCYRIGRCVGILQPQFHDGIMDQDTFQQLSAQEIDKSLIVRGFVAVGSSRGFKKQIKVTADSRDGIVGEKGVLKGKV